MKNSGKQQPSDCLCPVDNFQSPELLILRQVLARIRQSLRESAYLDGIFSRLDAFAEGKPFTPFRFSLALYEGRNVQHLDFEGDGESLSLSQGGFVYSSQIGGDTYLDWLFTLWPDGDRAGSLGLSDFTVREMLRKGAVLVTDDTL